MNMSRQYWKTKESHWHNGRYSYSSAEAYEYTHVFSSKKRAIAKMKENLRDWLEYKDGKHEVATVLLDTEDHITAMSYDAFLDRWDLLDIILESTTIS